jgi:hypothetical protein
MAATPKKPGATKGGARPNAGRPAKAETYATPIKDAEQRIADRLPRLIDKLFTLADGVVVQETDEEGRVDVYAKAPDLKALTYLVDRVMGKPTERVEAQATNDTTLRIEVEYADPEPSEQ